MNDMMEAFDAPYVHKVGGDDVRFPKFDLDELAELGASVKADRVAASKALVAEFSPIEQYRAQQEAAWSQVLDGDIYAYVQSPKGTLEVLHKSLRMAGVGVPAGEKAEDVAAAKRVRDAILRKIPPYTKTHIAMVITGVAQPKPVQKKLLAEDGGEPGFGDAEEREVKNPLAEGGSTSPST